MPDFGFVDIATAAVKDEPATFPNLGTFAPLTGPVIVPDGTVVLATRQGKVIALHPDGRPYWEYQLPSPQAITTAPVVGGDGSIYVLGYWTARDHRGGRRERIGFGALHRIFPGVPPHVDVTPFPEHGRGPSLIGQPKVWAYQGDEAIIVPTTYMGVGDPVMHLLAFGRTGGVMADWTEELQSGDVTGSGWSELFHTIFIDFEPGEFPPPVLPYPGVAISANPQGGTPFLVFIDRYFKRTIAFTFCVGPSCNPAPGFTERMRRSHAPRTLWSGGVVVPDTNQTVAGTDDGVVFGGPSGVEMAPLKGVGEVFATPTIAADGRVLIVGGPDRSGSHPVGMCQVTGLHSREVMSRVTLEGGTVGRPAASSNFVYVITTTGLHSLTAGGEVLEASFPLRGGGMWSPAIGPERHIYALTKDALHIFPPLQRLPQRPRGHGTGRVGGSEPGIG